MQTKQMIFKYEILEDNIHENININGRLTDRTQGLMLNLQKYTIRMVECFGDYIIIIYKDRIFFDIFKKNG